MTWWKFCDAMTSAPLAFFAIPRPAVSLAFSVLPAEPFVCLISIRWLTVWSPPPLAIPATSVAFAVFDAPPCVMKQVCEIAPVDPKVCMLQVAKFDDPAGCTMRHVWSGGVESGVTVPEPLSLLQTNLFSWSSSPPFVVVAENCTTFVEVVQFQPAPGQSGPA